MYPRPHKKLRVWQKAIDLVEAIYDSTREFPHNEEYGLKSQMRRAAVSVPSNIAEGLTRAGKNDRLRFLNIAHASLSEIDTQLEICVRVLPLKKHAVDKLEAGVLDVEMLLSGLIRSMR